MNNTENNEEEWLDKNKIRERHVYYTFKRVFDFVASLVGLVILSPIFLIIASCIKAEDWHGPIFYSQIRLGVNGRPFKMYKFRSMVVDADKKIKKLLDQNEVDGAMFKIKDDPRITKVGKFIRKYSLDELPQLYNVLIGDMSLVGPRPPLTREVVEYTDYDKQRLLVQPGCTGLWQVSGRNALGFSEMVELDLSYIKQSSILFDIIILFRTIKIMILPNDAY
ncbi:sugar transferase [Pediococcus damnosus]|uniref:sugar transferase n=1 Tax=Pediococcus damnosus TaxID=51663 RepID=UPI0009BA633A|nr:sugar transferase [Pediococcus damnosus]PIO86252.1 multidrug MFS transporter [Pediococcus damnosus]